MRTEQCPPGSASDLDKGNFGGVLGESPVNAGEGLETMGTDNFLKSLVERGAKNETVACTGLGSREDRGD